MTAGLIPADEGSDRLTVDRLALIERWEENFGLDGPMELLIAQQEAGHVAGLVDAAVESAVAMQREQYEAKLWLARNTTRGRCRWCAAVVDPKHPAAPKRPTPDGPAPLAEPQPHQMHCRLYVGPLEHRWERSGWNQTFGGYDQWCVCGGWFRQGGLAGHGDGSETAEPVCPNADQTWRGPR